MTKHYIYEDGTYYMGFEDDAEVTEPNVINLGDNPPEYADQVWQFPGWGPSLVKQQLEEDRWRVTELSLIAEQLLMLEDSDPSAKPGSEAEWRAYRILVRNWKAGGSSNYPNKALRPKQP